MVKKGLGHKFLNLSTALPGIVEYRVNIVVFFRISTQKGEHSCKCTELSLKRNERIVMYR